MASRLGCQRFHVKSFQSSIFESTIWSCSFRTGENNWIQLEILICLQNWTCAEGFQSWVRFFLKWWNLVSWTSPNLWNIEIFRRLTYTFFKCLQILWELGIAYLYSIYMIWLFEATIANPLPGVFVCIYICKCTNVHVYIHLYIVLFTYVCIYTFYSKCT